MALLSSGALLEDAAPQPVPPAPKPDPAKAQTSQRAFVLNVNKNRITKSGTNRDSVGPFTDVKKGLDFKDRLPLLVVKVKRVKASTVLTQEAGKYVDGDAFAKALGPQFKSTLHGDGRGDLTQAVVTDIEKRRIVGEGSFTTSSSPNHHNTATWVVAEDIATGIRICWGTSHMEYRAGLKYDKIREAQTKRFFAELEKIAKQFGTTFIIAGADYNSDDQQAYDGPGRAAKPLGFKDAEHIAATKKNAKYGTTIDVGGVDERVSDRHIDRFFIKGNITVHEWGIDIVLNAKGDLIKPHATDHLGVWISFTATKAA